MILVGSQRGSGLKLASHLTNDRDNDHVELYALRGFTSETLRGALQESEAIAKGTQCKQPFFSLSLNPPEIERASIADFEAAIDEAEARLGLKDQPRAIIFHEKNGRRHAHAVWSRIDVREMKAINLPFFKSRLKDLSKDLFLEHNWRLPKGLRDHGNRDPRNFTLAEWQQAKRAGKDARAIKRVFQEAWQYSDSAAGFARALEEKGYILARGDRRGFVALDLQGEVYAVPKWAGLKTRQVRERLGDPKALPSVAEAKAEFGRSMRPAVARWRESLAKEIEDLKSRHTTEHRALVEKQREARAQLKDTLAKRENAAALLRQARFRTGVRGIWDRLSGTHKRIRHQNEAEAWQEHLRDQTAIDAIVFAQLEARRTLKHKHGRERSQLAEEAREMSRDRSRFAEMRRTHQQSAREGPLPTR
ncbi:MAG: relaxase/mobilization nuclease domain-containing protein [Rhodobacteraceae bacterium]|nr:relaxase/mobilization nuclease domain-containing protein [Paracoccaceae bacterium]